MANTTMMFPNTVEEFMEQHKMVDTEQIYSNGIEYVPIFRMEQWFAHQPDTPRWIPVTERLPEKPFGCLVTVWDTDPISMDEFENLLPYFVGWDGEQWNDGEGIQCPFEVIAWMPLPTSYKGGEEE